MANQSTLPFASLGTPVKSPSRGKRPHEEEQTEVKRSKLNLPSPELEEVEVVDMTQEVDDDVEEKEISDLVEKSVSESVSGSVEEPIEEPLILQSIETSAIQSVDSSVKQPVIQGQKTSNETKPEPLYTDPVTSRESTLEPSDKSQVSPIQSQDKSDSNNDTLHKQKQHRDEAKLKQLKEAEKEEKRIKKEQEKQRREAKRKEIELEKLKKRIEIEQERRRKKEEQERQKELKKKAIELEREAKRLKIEQEKELKRKALDQEKEAKRLKIEQEKEERKNRIEKEKLQKQREKEEAERKKQEDEERKSRAQMRIGSFFKVKTEVTTPQKVVETQSHYSSSFLLFFIKENAELYQKWSKSADDISLNNVKFESALNNASSDALNFFKTTSNHFDELRKNTTAYEVVQAINNNHHSESQILTLLEQLSKKYLSFYENLRPPYSGTGSKSILSVNKCFGIELNKKPFTKINDSTIDYNYDSDLEWNPEEDDEGEGEEIDDEEMSAAEGSEEEDDDDFLEKDMLLKKRTLIGPLVPVIKVYSDLMGDSEDDKYFNSLAIEPLRFEYPIDPFHDYWSTKAEKELREKEIVTVTSLKPSVSSSKLVSSSPLRVNSNTVNVLTGHKKPKQVITNDIELLKVLQYVAANNDLSISTLVELTRKSLDNKYPNLVVRATIDKHFSKKNKKTYELNESNTITNLEAVVKDIANP